MKSNVAIIAASVSVGLVLGYALRSADPAPASPLAAPHAASLLAAPHAAHLSGVAPVPASTAVSYPLILRTDGDGALEHPLVEADLQVPVEADLQVPVEADLHAPVWVDPSTQVMQVPRELIAAYTSDLEGMSKLGRAIPHRDEEGRIDGYRLSGIRRGTIGEDLGIRNGDVLHAINGHKLGTVSEAMGAYKTLESTGSIRLEITRRGEPVVLEFRIQ